jgi:hypothetical protein
VEVGDLVRLAYERNIIGIIVGIKQSRYGFPPATYSVQWTDGNVGCVAPVDIEVINESR